ncbi:MAG: hypothetical protein EOO43_05140 [Flavobacterium sp.]|nr:MAG: hypothetical protein EOO43_05140 [Flavobacterium sp.]
MINDYENLLRSIILHFLGNDSNNYRVTPERIKRWFEKKAEEFKKYGLITEDRIIYYSDFYDLETIIDKNWEAFNPMLGDKRRFQTFFKEVSKFRNTIAHGRTLTRSQALILEGIFLDLKNQKTMYHNKNENKDDYFIRITKISDNLGNIWTCSHGPRPTLRVGDEYELLVEATDPKEREIEYQIFMFNNINIVQKSNRFNIVITQEMVSSFEFVVIGAYTPESSYNNRDSFNISVTIFPKL